jgi:hypothetical protein
MIDALAADTGINLFFASWLIHLDLVPMQGDGLAY